MTEISKKAISWMFAALLASACPSSFGDEILYWMLDNPKISDWCGNEYNLADQSATVSGKAMPFARVAAFQDLVGEKSYSATRLDDKFEGDIVFLDLYFQDDYGTWTLDIPNNDVAVISDGGKVEPYQRASIYASLAFAGKSGIDLNTISFAIELGAFDGNGDWQFAAISGSETYAALTGYISQQLDIPRQTPWSPDLFSAPEPSTGILILFGLSVFGLKRKKMNLEVCCK